jgi:signal transduction histidine kinase
MGGNSGRGLALLCDAEGTILEILRDDLSLGVRAPAGCPLSLFVDRASMTKALDLLVDLQANGETMGWELNVPASSRLVTLKFAGAVSETGLLIVAAESDSEVTELYEELVGIHNEQTNALRAALKEKAQAMGAARETGGDQARSPEPSWQQPWTDMYDELSRLNNELANLQRELAKKNAELERLNQVKDQFLGMAAHDLRTPLGIALGYSGFLMEDLGDMLDERHRKYLAAIRSSCRFMLRLVDGLLDVATIESGRLGLDRQPTDLAALVERNIDLNRALAEAKRIRLAFRYDGSLPEMLLDGSRIEQVLNNLLSNAIKFSYPGGIVEVHLAREAGYATLAVIDHGQGIPTERLDDLFQWFARSRVKGTAGEEGAGLGLAIAQKIVEAHMGDIWVESEPGRGSTFNVALPIGEDR